MTSLNAYAARVNYSLRRLVTASACLPSGAALPSARVICIIYSSRFCPRIPGLCITILATIVTKPVLDRHLKPIQRHHERITDKHHVVLPVISCRLHQCFIILLCSAIVRQQHCSHGSMLCRLSSIPISLRCRTWFRHRQRHRFERALVPRR